MPLGAAQTASQGVLAPTQIPGSAGGSTADTSAAVAIPRQLGAGLSALGGAPLSQPLTADYDKDLTLTNTLPLGGGISGRAFITEDDIGVTSFLKPSWLSAVQVIPRLTLSSYYDDNIFITHNDKVSDLVTRVTPGVSVRLGDYENRERTYIVLDYAATEESFANNSQVNAFEQALSLNTFYLRDRFSISLQGAYTDTQQADKEYNQRVHLINTSALLTAKYTFPKLDAGFQVRYQENDYDIFPSWNEILGGVFADYALMEKWKVGVEAAAGQAEIVSNQSQNFVQLLFRNRVDGFAHFSLLASGGLEERDFGAGYGSQTNWILDLTANYQPFTDTVLSIEGFRKIDPSPRESGRSLIETGATIHIVQRFRKNFRAELSASLEDLDFLEAGQSSGSGAGHESYSEIRPSLSYVSRHIIATLYAAASFAGSRPNQPGYTDHQVGIEFTVKF